MILNRRSSCNSHRRCTHYDYHHECQKLGDSGLFKRARLTEVLFRAIRTRNNTTFLLELWVTNKRGEVLVGSHYVLKNPPDQALAHHTVGTNTFIEFIYDALPCVIYLHGNSGCQWDACEILRPLLSANISVFAFDFAGCGNSDGHYITLGIHEREDTEAVVQYLRSDPM
eukprot:3379461-Pyramimonas_sp.AAC.1